MSEDIEITCDVLRETDKAYLVHNGEIEAWIPKSQVSDESESLGEITSIFIPEWLAEKSGLI